MEIPREFRFSCWATKPYGVSGSGWRAMHIAGPIQRQLINEWTSKWISPPELPHLQVSHLTIRTWVRGSYGTSQTIRIDCTTFRILGTTGHAWMRVCLFSYVIISFMRLWNVMVYLETTATLITSYVLHTIFEIMVCKAVSIGIPSNLCGWLSRSRFASVSYDLPGQDLCLLKSVRSPFSWFLFRSFFIDRLKIFLVYSMSWYSWMLYCMTQRKALGTARSATRVHLPTDIHLATA